MHCMHSHITCSQAIVPHTAQHAQLLCSVATRGHMYPLGLWEQHAPFAVALLPMLHVRSGCSQLRTARVHSTLTGC
jgi:hypothetical protein